MNASTGARAVSPTACVDNSGRSHSAARRRTGINDIDGSNVRRGAPDHEPHGRQ
jgi:hypothetical protein